ncbi:Rab7a [Symbiodinium sp. CCMP2592]|nr:Rab7a [Symbiodinium sp. CCMP2592]
MGQVTSVCERRHSRRLLPIEETCGSFAVSRTSGGHSILDSERFEQSLCNVLVQHGLRVRSNIYYNESLEILEDSTALHDAHIFVLQVQRQGLKHVEGVREKWNVHKGALDNARLRAYSRAVDRWFNGDKENPPPALGLTGEVLYEVDMKSEPAGPAVEHDLPEVAVRLGGNQVITLQRFIQERLHTPALIEIAIEAVLSDRKKRQIKKQCELAKHLGCTPVLFFNGMEEQKKAEKLQVALQQLQGSAPAQPTVIWACQLRKDDDFDEAFMFICKCFCPRDGSTIEVVGSAFKVRGAIADAAVDDLKKAIKAEKPNRVMCDADEIDIELFTSNSPTWPSLCRVSA